MHLATLLYEQFIHLQYTIHTVFSTQIYVFLVIFSILNFDLAKFMSKNCKHIFYQKFVHFGLKYFKIV